MAALPARVEGLKDKLRDLRLHARELLIGFVIVACVFVAAAAVSVAIDVHAMRVANLTASSQLETALGSRLDSLLWKVDTFNTTVLAMSKTLSTGLTQVRVQVEQASADQQQALAATTKSTAQAVEKTLDKTADVLQQQQQATTQPAPPIIQVQAPKTTTPQPSSPQQVFVTPVLPPPAQQPVDSERKPRCPRWLRRLWPFHHARATS
jgi:hypothetical protein